MKKLLCSITLAVAALVSAQLINARSLEVRASYEKSVVIPESVNSIQDSRIRQLAIAQLQSRINRFQMVFNGTKYGFSEEAVKNNRLTVTSENSVFIDFSTKEMSAQKTILDKCYIVRCNYAHPQWIVNHSEVRIINGKRCMRADSKSESGVTAWFCESIPCQMGPAGYGGLPGLIMELSTPSEKYTLCEFEVLPTMQTTIMKSQKGEPVSPAEFARIRSKKIQELGANTDNGVHIIKM